MINNFRITIIIHSIYRIHAIPRIQIRAGKLSGGVHRNPHSKHRIEITCAEVVQRISYILSHTSPIIGNFKFIRFRPVSLDQFFCNENDDFRLFLTFA